MIIFAPPDTETATKGHWECTGSSANPTEGATCSGFGPYVTIIRPNEGDVVSGQVRVEVAVSDADVGGRPIGLFVDKSPAPLLSYFEQLPSTEICDTQAGEDPGCPFVGFAGVLDTTQLSDGVHKLQVLAQRDDAVSPFLSWQELEFEVRNQSMPAQPNIYVVQQWDSQQVPDGGSYTFGERQILALPVVATFLVCNLGGDDLFLFNHSTMVTGDGFSRGFGSPASFVAPQNCSQLKLRFDVDDPGTYTGTVSIVSNDPDDDPYSFTISGTAVGSDTGPELVLREVIDGVETSNEYTNGQLVDLGDTPVTLGVSRVHSIRNFGTEDLTVTSLSVSGDCYFTGWSHDGLVIPPDGGVWFGTAYNCLDVDKPLGAYPGSVTIRSDDTSADPFSLQLRADLVVNPNPRLWVRRVAGGVPGDYVWNGQTVNFPSTPVGDPTSILFEIKNLSSSANLVISNPSTLVSGTCFKQIGTDPATVVPPLSTTTLRVRLHCQTAGSQSGMVTIQSNDPNWPGPGTLQYFVSGTVTSP